MTAATSKATQAQTQQFFTFHLPGEQMAMLPTQQLIEVLNISLGQIVPIPDVTPSVMGVCNWRGEVVWVVDLGYMLGFEPLFQQGYIQANLNVILIRDRGQTLGLAVKQIGQMIWCDLAQIQTSPATHITAELARSLRGYWLSPKGEMMLVLDGDALFETMNS